MAPGHAPECIRTPAVAVNWRMNWAPNPAFGSCSSSRSSRCSASCRIAVDMAIFTVVTAAPCSDRPARERPVWFAVILLVLVYQWSAGPQADAPFGLLRRPPGAVFQPFVHLWNALIWIVFMLFLAWLAAATRSGCTTRCRRSPPDP